MKSETEKSGLTDFGNDNVLIKIELLETYFNNEGNDADINQLNLTAGNVGEKIFEEILTERILLTPLGVHLLNYCTKLFLVLRN